MWKVFWSFLFFYFLVELFKKKQKKITDILGKLWSFGGRQTSWQKKSSLVNDTNELEKVNHKEAAAEIYRLVAIQPGEKLNISK